MKEAFKLRTSYPVPRGHQDVRFLAANLSPSAGSCPLFTLSLLKPRFSACHFSVLLQTKRLRQIYWRRIVCPTREMENGVIFGNPLPPHLTSPPSVGRNRERIERDPRGTVSFKFAPQSGIDRKGFSAPWSLQLPINGRGRSGCTTLMRIPSDEQYFVALTLMLSF